MSDRRKVRRRSLPFVRSAVLEHLGKGHIVVLSDLSVDGAFLTTRAALDLGDPLKTAPLRLRLVVPRDSREISVPCELVWRSDRFDAATGRPAGIAVRFRDMPPEVQERVEEFAHEGFRPSAPPSPGDRYEHRVIERKTVDAAELNRFGQDGWQLVTVLPADSGWQLVLSRRI
jgi:hypothetical protein